MTRAHVLNLQRYKFDDFIDSLIGLDIDEMADALNHECSQVVAGMYGRGGPRARADGGAIYVARLEAVGFWLNHGVLAAGRREVRACWRLGEDLVARGQLKPEALNAIRLSV